MVAAADVADAARPEAAFSLAAGTDLVAVVGAGPATAAVFPSMVTPWLSPGKLHGAGFTQLGLWAEARR